MRRISCEHCGEALRVDDLVIMNRQGNFFCNRECETQHLLDYYGGDDYCLVAEDFSE